MKSMVSQYILQKNLYKSAVFNSQRFWAYFGAWILGRGWGISVRGGGPGDVSDCRKNKKGLPEGREAIEYVNYCDIITLLF